MYGAAREDKQFSGAQGLFSRTYTGSQVACPTHSSLCKCACVCVPVCVRARDLAYLLLLLLRDAMDATETAVTGVDLI